MKTKKLFIVISFVLIICFIVSTALSVRSVGKLVVENNRENAYMIAGEIKNAVNDKFSESKAVSEALNNTLVRQLIAERDTFTPEEISVFFGGYLSDIKEQFECSTAFMTLQNDYAYFTEWGFIKNLDPENPDDDWFERFRDSGKDFELNIDNDQANDNRITVYVNYRMEDENGDFIGVCGVGVKLDEINSLISTLEAEHSIKIELISTDGKVQVAGEESLKQQADSDALEMIEQYRTSDSYLYSGSRSGQYRILSYIQDCRWYLFIEHGESTVSRYRDIIRDNVVAYLIMLIVLGFIGFILSKLNKDNELLHEAAEIDKLTNVGNRRAYEDAVDEYRSGKNIRDLTVFVADINGLKGINDTLGHSAGDTAIKETAEGLCRCFAEDGNVYRTGGDEFIVLVGRQEKNSGEIAASVKAEIEQCEPVLGRKLSVSVGFACGNWDECENVDDLITLATEECTKTRIFSTAIP